MTDSIKLIFFKLLNEDISIQEFEAWLYNSTNDLEKQLPNDLYISLISFNYRQKDTLNLLYKLISDYIHQGEFEFWRIKELLTKIVENRIDFVVGIRALSNLYITIDGESVQNPLGRLLSSELDGFPIPSEYNLWDDKVLKEKLEELNKYKVSFLIQSKEFLN